MPFGLSKRTVTDAEARRFDAWVQEGQVPSGHCLTYPVRHLDVHRRVERSGFVQVDFEAQTVSFRDKGRLVSRFSFMSLQAVYEASSSASLPPSVSERNAEAEPPTVLAVTFAPLSAASNEFGRPTPGAQWECAFARASDMAALKHVLQHAGNDTAGSSAVGEGGAASAAMKSGVEAALPGMYQTIVRAGVLERRLKSGGYARRFVCVLPHRCLIYAGGDGDGEGLVRGSQDPLRFAPPPPRAVLLLGTSTACEALHDGLGTVKLTCPGNWKPTHEFRAGSDDVADLWVQAFRDALVAPSPNGGLVGGLKAAPVALKAASPKAGRENRGVSFHSRLDDNGEGGLGREPPKYSEAQQRWISAKNKVKLVGKEFLKQRRPSGFAMRASAKADDGTAVAAAPPPPSSKNAPPKPKAKRASLIEGDRSIKWNEVRSSIICTPPCEEAWKDDGADDEIEAAPAPAPGSKAAPPAAAPAKPSELEEVFEERAAQQEISQFFRRGSKDATRNRPYGLAPFAPQPSDACLEHRALSWLCAALKKSPEELAGTGASDATIASTPEDTSDSKECGTRLVAACRSGVALCELVNLVSPSSTTLKISRVRRPSVAGASLGVFQQKENLRNFVVAAKGLGVNPVLVLGDDELHASSLAPKTANRLAELVEALARHLAAVVEQAHLKDPKASANPLPTFQGPLWSPGVRLPSGGSPRASAEKDPPSKQPNGGSIVETMNPLAAGKR